MPKRSSHAGTRLPFSLFLGLRYLKPKRTFVSLITLISIVGVMLGIAILVIVIAVMTGFEMEMKRKILSFESTLTVSSPTYIEEWEPLLEQVKSTPEVTGAAPYVLGPVLGTFKNRAFAPKLKAVDMQFERGVSQIESMIVTGEANLEGDHVLVAEGLASKLGVQLGDKITLFSPSSMDQVLHELDLLERETKVDESGQPLQEPRAVSAKSIEDLRQMVLPIELTVTGIFKSGRNAFDAEFIVVPLYIGQELYTLQGGVHGLTASTKDPYRVGIPKQMLNEKLPEPLIASSWMENNAELFNAVANERRLLFLLLFCVMIVAAFCVMNTMITVTVQKTREIGVMKAIGASTTQIVWVFLAQGVVVGIFGNLAGLSLALTLLHFRNDFTNWLADTLNYEFFPQAIYQLAEIPAEIVPRDIAVICVSSFVVCSLAALVPAWFASQLDPVKALRHE